MSKKLNEEYERFASQSAPDLWSRIEEALPEKKKQTAWRKYRKIIPAAAAVLVVAVCVPTAYVAGFFGLGISRNNKSAADSVVPNVFRAVAEYEMTAEAAPQEIAEEEDMSRDTDQATEQDTNGTFQDSLNSCQQDEAEKKESCISGSEIQEDAEQEVSETMEQGRLIDLPFPEMNRTVWENGKLLSVEVKMERKDHSTTLEGGNHGTWDIDSYFELPVLQEDTKAVKKINQNLVERYEEGVEEYEEWKEDFKEAGGPKGYYCWDTYLSYNHGGIINFGVYEEVWAGGVIDRRTFSFTYDLNTGKRLNLADILGIDEEELQEALLKGFQQSAKDEPDNTLWEVFTPETLCEQLKDYEIEDFHYCISQEGEVDIWFAKYELMSGADGMQMAAIGKVNYGQR